MPKKVKCIDPEIFEKTLNAKLKKSKLKGSTRTGCSWMESIDIGAIALVWTTVFIAALKKINV